MGKKPTLQISPDAPGGLNHLIAEREGSTGATFFSKSSSPGNPACRVRQSGCRVDPEEATGNQPAQSIYFFPFHLHEHSWEQNRGNAKFIFLYDLGICPFNQTFFPDKQ